MTAGTEPRQLGLHQVFPDPRDTTESNKRDVDIIAIHGLDTHSPKTWVAWKIDGDRHSGEVHWLKDRTMLPSVISNARIITYDWNANYDKDSEAQFLLSHADSLLNKLRNMRNKDNKTRPIVFIASCFGGLLLSKALYRASETNSRYQSILKSTCGIIFLGTPFRGSSELFRKSTEIRLSTAIAMGAETNGGLLKFLQSEPNNGGQLDELVQCFSEMITQRGFKIRIVCFWETKETNFANALRSVPIEPGEHEKRAEILVPFESANLLGHQILPLSVRHAMLNKYANREDESFKEVSSTLKELVDEAQKMLHNKMSLRDDPMGMQIATFLKSGSLNAEKDSEIDGLVFKARILERLKGSTGTESNSVLSKVFSRAHDDLSQSLQGLTIIVKTTARIAENPTTDTALPRDFTDKTLSEIEDKVAEVCRNAQDILLLDSDIDPEEAIDDDVSAAVEAKSIIDLRQHVIQTMPDSEDRRLRGSTIIFNDNRPKAAQARFRYGIMNGKPVIVESFPYSPMEGTTDVSPKSRSRINRVLERLSHPQRTSSYVLPCFGYTQDAYNKRIGFVFGIGPEYVTRKPPISLEESYTEMKRVPLGQRLRLAYALAVAVEGLHRVGWVHEELSSQNIFIFEKKMHVATAAEEQSAAGEVVELGFSYPYLFGFTWSRPEDAETDLRSDFSLESNTYRHPGRWGKPTKFTKAHDVYSLGVILFEVIQWGSAYHNQAKNLERKLKKEGRSLDSADLKKKLLTITKDRLSFVVGESISNVIRACFEYDDMTRGKSELEAHRVFKLNISEVLKRLVEARL